MLLEIEWHPTARQLRVFGVSGLCASIVAALLLHFAWGAPAFWGLIVLAAGTTICLCGLLAPAAARILYIGLTLVALPIGFVVSFLLLAAFYFLLLTPLALVFRLIGRDPLCRSWHGRGVLQGRTKRWGPCPGLARPNRDARVAIEEQGQDALATSYWVPHQPSEDMERYFHQF